MNERLKNIRLSLNLSQEEFGSRIGIKSRAHISALENGSRTITDRIATDICREFDINELWLRTGEGEMLKTPDDEFEILTGKMSMSEDELLKELTKILWTLDEVELKALKKVVEKIKNNPRL